VIFLGHARQNIPHGLGRAVRRCTSPAPINARPAPRRAARRATGQDRSPAASRSRPALRRDHAAATRPRSARRKSLRRASGACPRLPIQRATTNGRPRRRPGRAPGHPSAAGQPRVLASCAMPSGPRSSTPRRRSKTTASPTARQATTRRPRPKPAQTRAPAAGARTKHNAPPGTSPMGRVAWVRGEQEPATRDAFTRVGRPASRWCHQSRSCSSAPHRSSDREQCWRNSPGRTRDPG
jgi:hypothetical protein